MIWSLLFLLAGCEAHPNRDTTLISAARTGNVPALQALLRHGADRILRAGVNDWTPLMHAVHKNQQQQFNDRGIAVAGGHHQGDPDRFTLGTCQVSTVQALLRKDPSLKLPDNFQGRTARFAAMAAKLRGCPY